MIAKSPQSKNIAFRVTVSTMTNNTSLNELISCYGIMKIFIIFYFIIVTKILQSVQMTATNWKCTKLRQHQKENNSCKSAYWLRSSLSRVVRKENKLIA